MIIQLKPDATKTDIRTLTTKIKKLGLDYDISTGEKLTIVGVKGETSTIDPDVFNELYFVRRVIRISRPYKLASREYHPKDTVVNVAGVKIGGRHKPVTLAGPCSIESLKQMDTIARDVKKGGAKILRAMPFKPRTSPYSFQGLGEEGLKITDKVRKKYGIPIVMEATGESVIDSVLAHADVMQLGTRNMESFDFLKMVGRKTAPKQFPVLLKRGWSSSIEEFLLAAEYIMNEGNPNVMLCLRGMRWEKDKKFLRNISDIDAIPVLRKESHLPIIFDPSHAVGDRELVLPISKAAIAAGADGLLNLITLNCSYGTVVTAVLNRELQSRHGVPMLTLVYEGLEKTNEKTRLEAFMQQVRNRWETASHTS